MTTLEAEQRASIFRRARDFCVREATNIKVTAGLGAIATMSYQYEQLGLSKEAGTLPELVDTSMSHPVLGYAGGLIVGIFATLNKGINASRRAYLAAGVSLTIGLDALAEITQSGVQTNFDYNPITNGHFGESFKDLLFAGAGYLGYLAVNKNNPSEREQGVVLRD